MVTAYFKRNREDINGVFTIKDSDGTLFYDKVHTRSGQEGYTDSHWERGLSPIPVGRHRLWLFPQSIGQRAGRKGIGEFFYIGSKDKQTIWNVGKKLKREWIGLHEENAFDGSAGCIVIVSDTQDKEDQMLKMWKFLKALGREYVKQEKPAYIPVEVFF